MANGKDKVIKLSLDLSDLQQAGGIRNFIISGDKNAEFILEVKNEDSYYYNFTTNVFQAAKSRLEETITREVFEGSIKFPSISDNDQYDIYLYAKPGTKHVRYLEKRFDDGSLDLNGSKGSNSLMMQKVIYQYTDLTLTIGKISPNSTIEMTGTGHSTDSVTVPRNGSKNKLSFSLKSLVSTASKAYTIIKQPTPEDIIGTKTVTVGSAPVLLPGEDEYPTARAAFTGDDVNGAVGSGTVVRMDNTDLSAVIAVGDKITAATTTGTVNGAIADGDKIVLDEEAATVMAVGDQVTGCAACGSNIAVVKIINPDGDNGNEFQVENVDGTEFATVWEDDQVLTFSSKVNRSHTTVTVVETSGTATDFTMSQAIKFRDDQPLTFTPRANYQWPLSDIVGIQSNMIVVPGTNVTANTVVSDYENTTTIFEGTENETTIVQDTVNSVNTLGAPTITNGVITAQTGNVVFNQQQALLFAGDSIDIGAYGEVNISNLSGYDLRVTNLAINLTPIKTTTTAAVSNSATIPVTSVNGILPNTSTISGIGIDASKADPLITARSATSGGGNLTASAAQTLESGQEFTFPGAGQEAIITGDIEILKAGTSSLTIYFDVEKLLTIT